MASVFTYDPDPPRVSSPWLPLEDADVLSKPSRHPASCDLLSRYGVTKLRAEPQEGPTEYKLHLLWRPRRTYTAMSTIGKPGDLSQTTQSRDAHSTKPPTLTNPASSNRPRQERLKHLTTQLLWRMQQSSPYHATSSKEPSIPKLPETIFDVDSPIKLEPLAPGLEESRGALYEIGVSDDGTLVGLTHDELNESITTLRIMAASLGCNVDIVRMVIVGDCEWEETKDLEFQNNETTSALPIVRRGKLWVAEALITPNVGLRDLSDEDGKPLGLSAASSRGLASANAESVAVPSLGCSTTTQLRVTLTGPTTSGKSSLLGTLCTGTLDNGRGKSRLSLLKHRHEMASGVTSSIAQELIGYKDNSVLNFSQGNIESWVDIHDYAEHGRLVLLSDSGGHPRYRRTVLRGLMNWAPHWNIVCVAADAAENALNGVEPGSTARDVPGAESDRIDLIAVHLNLALKLQVPMAVVITKMDLASKQCLQRTMIKVLTAIKNAGRSPKILQPDQIQRSDLQDVPAEDLAKTETVVKVMLETQNLTSLIPIVLTSAVSGTGIGLLHALLSTLPLPPVPTSRDYVGMALNPEQPECLFYVDDTFSLPKSYCALATNDNQSTKEGVVVSGHVRFGSLSVGDQIMVGPFQADDESRGLDITTEDQNLPEKHGLALSYSSSVELARIATKRAVSARPVPGEWHRAQIVSTRNLRLPVRTLEADQAGSIGIVFQLPDDCSSTDFTEIPRVRRGMILAKPSRHMLNTELSLQAASGFTAFFRDPAVGSLTTGTFVNVYIATVRATARISHVSYHKSDDECTTIVHNDDIDDDVFGLQTDVEIKEPVIDDNSSCFTKVSLELLHGRQWIELGSKVVILEGGSQDRSGLEGYVGKVIEMTD